MTDAAASHAAACDHIPAPTFEPAALAVVPSEYAPRSRNALFRRQTPAPRRRAATRNARRRNAGPGPASAPKPRVSMTLGPKSGAERLGETIAAMAAAGAATFGGALAAKWTGYPKTMALVLTGAGVAVAARSQHDLTRGVATSIAATGMSQLVVSAMSPPPPPAARPTPVVAGIKNSDLGGLPPGFLDSAFETARSELAMGADPQHHPYIPFVP